MYLIEYITIRKMLLLKLLYTILLLQTYNNNIPFIIGFKMTSGGSITLRTNPLNMAKSIQKSKSIDNYMKNVVYYYTGIEIKRKSNLNPIKVSKVIDYENTRIDNNMVVKLDNKDNKDIQIQKIEKNKIDKNNVNIFDLLFKGLSASIIINLISESSKYFFPVAFLIGTITKYYNIR